MGSGSFFMYLKAVTEHGMVQWTEERDQVGQQGPGTA